jgi:hypothetical protein
MATKQSKLHGRVEGARARCAAPGCSAPGEFKAPLQAANFDGPGSWRFLCLDHVREHNAKYNFFEGMSPDEIQDAQGPLGGWERPSRRFATNGADPPPAWSDFADPLDAISTRPVDSNDYPVERCFIRSVKIVQREELPPPPAPETPIKKSSKRWWQIFG